MVPPSPAVAPEDLLLARFHGHVDRRPDATWLSQPMGGGVVDHFSFARAFDEASRMAAWLRALELPPGSRVAILSKNCAHFILAELAIWMAGHVSVALYPTLDAATVRYILEHSEAQLLFVGKLDTWDEMRPGVPEGLKQVSFPLSPTSDLPTWSELIAQVAPLPERTQRPASDLALLLYTSGSTGQPKGVMHDFASISAATVGIVRALGLNEADRMLSYLPLAHAMERWLIEFVSFVAGGHIFFAESLDTFVHDLARARPTIFLSVPRLWLKFQLGVFRKMPPKKLSRLLKIPVVGGLVRRKVLAGLGLDQVRLAGSGSAPIPGDLIQWYRDLGLELLEGYGMSENFSYSHLSLPGKARVGYVGSTYPEVMCRLTDEGEVLVKSPGSMRGYYKQPEVSAECFTEDGFLRTGDRGEIDGEGRLRITGRVKELFKTSKGKYVAPAPIENLINNDPHVELSCVAGSGYPEAHAVVQLSEDLLPTLADPAVRARVEAALGALLDQVNAQVLGYERLAFLAVAREPWTIEAGFLTPTLKIKRARIEDAYSPQLDAWYADKSKVIWEQPPAA